MGLLIANQVRLCDAPLTLCNSGLAVRSLHLTHAIQKGYSALQCSKTYSDESA